VIRNFNIPPDLHRKFKIYCAETNQSMSGLLTKAIELVLENYKQKQEWKKSIKLRNPK